MRALASMRAAYIRKLTARYAGTVLATAVTKMADDYMSVMTPLRDKQLLVKDTCNENEIPSGRQASMQMFCNKLWYLTVTKAYSGPTAVLEAQAALAYFKARYLWGIIEAEVAATIVTTIFNITLL